MACSYCKLGLNDKVPLDSPRPRGDLAKMIESNSEERVIEDDMQFTSANDSVACNTETPSIFGGGSDTNTQLHSNFDLSDELWQCV